MSTDISYWNRQFQFSAILPDFADHLAWMERDSLAVGGDLALQRTPYGADKRQWVEVAGDASMATLVPVFVHGGYWRALTAEQHRCCLPGFKRACGIVGNLEYRLMPKVRLADLVEDVIAGLTAVASMTPGRLVPIGHSAGAHLAIEAYRRCEADLRGRIAHVVGLSGIYDLRPVPYCFLQAELNLIPDEVDDYSPVDAPGFAPETLKLFVGADETPEFHRQAQMLASVTGCSVSTVDGAHHMGVLKALADPASDLISVMLSGACPGST